MTTSTNEQISAAATLVRLYVFLTQHLDRYSDKEARENYPDSEFKQHLTTTHHELMKILRVNPVVRNKVDQEYTRILSLGESQDAQSLMSIATERAIIVNKTIALSDLIAVFRAMD